MAYKLQIDTLDDEYQEPDEILLHSMFAAFEIYLAQEEGFPHDHTHSEDAIHFWSEVVALRKWWHEDLPARKEPPHIPGMKSFLDKGGATQGEHDLFHQWVMQVHAAEEAWAAEDEEMMIRLIKIRRGLWT